ncbi:formate dehydrogenase subunit gamma [Shewanella fodinae]|jgi:formate dehydrogenase subunit gamma|uniref:formate dehydrogenase subunit gamma n=1 Tax=Shewanella fodinae TaxID=552357 RepID=UPI0016748A3C|nr:formate dehydrogenase subunit gamma [Shewanella fodinae]MCL2906175.1 formate dehydrogenase subunit gamma [Shewanella fodinae]GGY98930.1 formate dehydrogenase subunit gamma [Shewanella fodinae]
MVIKSLRSLFALMLLVCGMGLSATAFAADQQSSQQQATAQTSEADLWRAVKSGEAGYTTAKGGERGVLINVTGEQGREIRNKYVTPVMGIAVVGVFGAFLLFYFVNGPARLNDGFSGKMVFRWSKADLILHWCVAISCLTLIFTGLNIMLGKHVLQPMVGEGSGIWASLIYGSKTIHDWVGPFFIVCWAILVVKWMPHQMLKGYDFKWFLTVGGYFNVGPLKGKHADSGFANAGEKAWFWTLAIFGLFIAISGVMMVLPGLDLPREASMAALLVHGVSAILIIAFTIVHIWMATVLSEGGMECMVSGYCDENWAMQHHNLWYDEIKANGTLKYRE